VTYVNRCWDDDEDGVDEVIGSVVVVTWVIYRTCGELEGGARIRSCSVVSLPRCVGKGTRRGNADECGVHSSRIGDRGLLGRCGGV
jgi:hypothetical protein